MTDGFSELKGQFKCLSNQIQKGREESMREFSGINSQLHIIQERLSRLENGAKKVDAIGGFTTTSSSTRQMLLDDVHKETIIGNLEYMVENFNPTNTHLLDDLVGEYCLSSDEAASVHNQSRRKDKVRKLMCIVGTKDRGKFKTFLSVLENQNDNNFIASHLRNDFEERSKNTSLQKKCIKCTIKRTVNLKDVVDKLCQYKLVDLNFVNLVLSSDVTRDQSGLWDALFHHFDSSSDRRYFIKIFQEALAVKHEQIAACFSVTLPRAFNCQCNKINSTLRVPNSQGCSSGSTGDISTTETHGGVYLENASHQAVSDDIISSVSDMHSNDVSENIPKTFTAEWIVNASFSYENEYPDLNTPSPTTASSSRSFNLSRPPSFKLQNIGENILKASSLMIGKKEISSEIKKETDRVNLNDDGIAKTSGFTSSMKQIETEKLTIAGSSEMSAGKQNHSESTSQSECVINNGQNETQHKKKKNRKARKRNKSEPNSAKQTPLFDNKNITTDVKPRAMSVDYHTNLDKTEVTEKTECLMKMLTFESPKEDFSLPRDKDVYGEIKTNSDENRKPFPSSKDSVFAHEQPIITPSKKVNHLSAGIPATQPTKTSSRTKCKKSNRKS